MNLQRQSIRLFKTAYEMKFHSFLTFTDHSNLNNIKCTSYVVFRPSQWEG
jgi:hypothetical protein